MMERLARAMACLYPMFVYGGYDNGEDETTWYPIVLWVDVLKWKARVEVSGQSILPAEGSVTIYKHIGMAQHGVDLSNL